MIPTRPSCYAWELQEAQSPFDRLFTNLNILFLGSPRPSTEPKTPKPLEVSKRSPEQSSGSPTPLDGPNRQSPIASVQRLQPTLASHAAVPRGRNVKRMNANRAIRIAEQQTQGL